jgi:hypothetical protein
VRRREECGGGENKENLKKQYMSNRRKITNPDDSTIKTLHDTYIKKGLTKEEIYQLDFLYNNPQNYHNNN